MKRMKALLVAFYLVVTMVLLSLVANAGLAVGDLFYTSCPVCGVSTNLRLEYYLQPTASNSGSIRISCVRCNSSFSRVTKYWGTCLEPLSTLGLGDVILYNCSCGKIHPYFVLSLDGSYLGILSLDSNCKYGVSAPFSSFSHSYTETRRTPATCTSTGSILSTCSRCNKTKTESIPIISHRWVEFSRIPSTCLPGSVVYTCSMCKKTKTESIPANPAAHTWTETFRPPATCLPGTINYTCSICNQTKTEPLPADPTAHAWTETSRTPATCLPGTINYTCSACNQTKTEPLSADPTAHAWTETSRTPATCLPGSINYTCSTCQDTKTETIPAKENAHTYDVAEIVPATYDPDGNLLTASYIRYACTACGDSYNTSIGGGSAGPIINDGEGGDGMGDATATLGKTFLSGVWALFGIYVPGFSFTFGQMWLGVLLASLSILVIRMMFGFGGGPRGESPRTSSTNNPKISKERRHDEF